MEDDEVSTATMTSVTEDFSLDETDTSTNDIETSSQLTSSDAKEGNTTVVDTPLLRISGDQLQGQAAVIDVSMEGGGEQDEIDMMTEEDSAQNTASARSKKQSKQSAPQSSRGWQHPGSSSQIPDFLSMPGRWYEHECFNHYWRHYYFVSMWRQKHMETYKTVVEQYNKVITQQMAAKQTQAKNQSGHVFKKPISSKTIRNRKARRRRKAAKKRLRTALRNAELAGSCSSLTELSDCQNSGAEVEGETTESVVEGEGKDEDMELQITDEMLDFFAHTHKHRLERDALKKSKNGQDEKHINIEEGDEKKNRTETAPAERPGSKRTSEMRLLYGKGAAMIHGMETALQMTFDRNMDVLQPRFWPNMPFRIIF